MKKRVLSFLLAAVMIFSLCAVSVPYVSAAENLKTSEACVALIKDFEGFRLKPELDYTQYSVGYGSACGRDDYPNGITREEADRLLRNDLVKIESKLNNFAANYDLSLSQKQFDALVSFTYNLGSNWMNNTSTFRSAVIDGATGNDFIFAITQWCNAGGSIVPGLVQRRLAEANLYLNGVHSKTPPANYRYVIFDNNMESAVSTIKIQGYDVNQTDTLRAVPAKAAYRFIGWYTQPTGGECVTTTGANIPETLYAHWQSVNNDAPEGTPANYVRYAGDKQPVYDTHNGNQIKTLTAGTQLTIVADYMDNNGVKWGKLSEGGWVKLNETREAETETQGQAVNLKVMVTSSGVNIRKGPGTSYPKSGRADKGDILQLTRVQQGGSYLWGQFSEGWVCLDYTDYEVVLLENSEEANKITATGVVNTTTLRIRARPTTASEQVGTYSKGDKVTITLQLERAGWGKTDKGWIYLDYVKLTPVVEEETIPPTEEPTEEPDEEPTEEPTEDPTEAPTEPKNEVIETGEITGCTTLRIRAGASTKYAQVGSLAAGTKVSIYEIVGSGSQTWARIDKGWISMNYVKLVTGESDDSAEDDSKDDVDTNEQKPVNGYVVNCDQLNIRAGAGTGYDRVGKLARGTKVVILETTKVGKTTWGRISKGWISMYYIQLGDEAPESSGSGSSGTAAKAKSGVVVNASEVRLRKEPGTSSKQVGTLKKGDRVVILETAKYGSATWGRTEKGWIHMFYVKLDSKDVPAGSVVRTVTASTLRIREAAGTSHDVVGSYTKGTQVVILEQTTVGKTTWGRTSKGWISMYYVK